MPRLMARLQVQDDVDLDAFREAFKAALATTPGVLAVEVEPGDETVDTVSGTNAEGGLVLEESSRFYLRGSDGTRVAVEQLHYYLLRVLLRAGLVRGGKKLAELVLVESALDVAPGTLSSAYSRLRPVMEAAGFPLVKRHGVYGFKSAEAKTKHGRASIKRRRKLEEEV